MSAEGNFPAWAAAHGGQNMPRMECSQMMSAVAEVLVLKTLREHQIFPAAVYAVPSAVLFQQIRVALSRTVEGTG
jgi:hypothetical protein